MGSRQNVTRYADLLPLPASKQRAIPPFQNPNKRLANLSNFERAPERRALGLTSINLHKSFNNNELSGYASTAFLWVSDVRL
jgi:hypothetical protein